jgi:hypothetical protein
MMIAERNDGTVRMLTLSYIVKKRKTERLWPVIRKVVKKKTKKKIK